MKRGISKFEQDGVLVIIAAGNEANDNDGFISAYPASYENENIISVASTDEDGSLSVWDLGGSNWGKSSVDLAAPGSEILSAKVETRTIKSYTFNSSMEGWSHASPFPASLNKSTYEWTRAWSIQREKWGLSDGSWSTWFDSNRVQWARDLPYKPNTYTFCLSPWFDPRGKKGFRLKFEGLDVSLKKGDEASISFKFEDSDWLEFSEAERTKNSIDFSRFKNKRFRLRLELKSNDDFYTDNGIFIDDMLLQDVPTPFQKSVYLRSHKEHLTLLR